MEFNVDRTTDFMSYGLVVYGPLLHYSYNHLIPLFANGNSLRALGKKLFFTQTAFSCFSIASFFTYMSLKEGKGLDATYNEVSSKLGPTMITNWKVWPLLQLINFKFVPLPLQVLYVNFMAIWWNAYLSFMKN